MLVNFSVQNFGSIKDKQTLTFIADKTTHLEEHYIIDAVDGLHLLKLDLIKKIFNKLINNEIDNIFIRFTYKENKIVETWYSHEKLLTKGMRSISMFL